MSVPAIEIDTNRLNSDIQSLRRSLSSARKHIGELQQSMDQLNQMWKGPANREMRLRFQRDHGRLLDLCGLLEELLEVLERIRISYDSCESSVRSTVDALFIEQ